MDANDTTGETIGVEATSAGTVNREEKSTLENILDIRDTVRTLQTKLNAIDKRINHIEMELSRLSMNNRERPRSAGRTPSPHAMKHTSSTVSTTRSNSPSSDHDETRARGGVTASVGTAQQNTHTTNPVPPATSVSSPNTPAMVKNKSAMPSGGYRDKHSLWGTALASLMVACMRRYMDRTGDSEHTLDEMLIMETCTKIVGPLYERIKYGELPAVDSPEAAFLSQLLSRSSQDEVPQSDPSTWLSLQNHPDGVAAMSVMESLFRAAKMVPEAMPHPISGLIAHMQQPFVVDREDGGAFAITIGTIVNKWPTGIETFCSFLKGPSLRVYVKYRLDGHVERDAVIRMSMTMRESEMFDDRLYRELRSEERWTRLGMPEQLPLPIYVRPEDYDLYG
ncbi:hypothetical protein E4U55_004984 [Claviceps digitariae]|nr:hypothetical protein E4U55_004984 [Claviceps digitariae]